jgi:hypothetical protein
MEAALDKVLSEMADAINSPAYWLGGLRIVHSSKVGFIIEKSHRLPEFIRPRIVSDDNCVKAIASRSRRVFQFL